MLAMCLLLAKEVVMLVVEVMLWRGNEWEWMGGVTGFKYLARDYPGQLLGLPEDGVKRRMRAKAVWSLTLSPNGMELEDGLRTTAIVKPLVAGCCLLKGRVDARTKQWLSGPTPEPGHGAYFCGATMGLSTLDL